jgi:hypothetical protein
VETWPISPLVDASTARAGCSSGGPRGSFRAGNSSGVLAKSGAYVRSIKWIYDDPHSSHAKVCRSFRGSRSGSLRLMFATARHSGQREMIAVGEGYDEINIGM